MCMPEERNHDQLDSVYLTELCGLAVRLGLSICMFYFLFFE